VSAPKSNKGKWIWLAAKGKIVERDGNGRSIRAIGTVIDISDQKAVEIVLEHEKEIAQTTLESINEAVITTDKTGLITSMNHKAQQLLSISESKAIGNSFDSLCTLKEESSSVGTHNPIMLCIQSDLAFNLTALSLTNKIAKAYYIDCSVSPLHDSTGCLVGCVMVIRDVTMSRKITQEIEHRAQHDSLTGIYNRHAFEAALDRNTQADEFEHVLCYIDLDQFKIVNDTCGHIAGDELLRQLFAELSIKIRKSDVFARLGGDEFGVLMLNCNIKQALKIAKSIKQVVTDYAFHWEDKVFKLGASIGLSKINASTSPAVAMQQADAACFSAKEQGRDRIHAYRADDKEMASTKGQMGWVPRLQQALKENYFILYVQAITDLKNQSAEPSHFEVLIRLNENNTIIPQALFYPRLNATTYPVK
jgi:Amt family ammonium transporter